MKIVKKERQVKKVEVTVECYKLCDKCNKRIESECYDSFECEFNHKTGNEFPEGGSGELQSVHLCKKCAVECVDLLRSNGYRINNSDWDC